MNATAQISFDRIAGIHDARPDVVPHMTPRLEALCDGLDRTRSQPRSMSALVARSGANRPDEELQ